MKFKRKANYIPGKNYKIIRKVDSYYTRMRKAEMDEEIIDLCNKIRKHTNKIEAAIRKDKQELEQQKQEMK